jgi:ABC-type arginine/histidine transport system permease subunit
MVDMHGQKVDPIFIQLFIINVGQKIFHTTMRQEAYPQLFPSSYFLVVIANLSGFFSNPKIED